MLHRFLAAPRLPALLGFICALALGAHPAAAQFTPTVDGTIPNGSNNQDEYVTAAPRASGVGNGTAPEAERILYYADDANQTLYVGVRGALPTDSDPEGLALWLNFQELDGAEAGTDLSVSGAGHYMNDGPFQADFEVDYMLALHKNSSLEVQVEAVQHVGTAASQNLGTSDQSGTSTTNINSDFFSAGSVTFAFNNTGEKDEDGFEIAIPYGELGITRAGAMEAFAGTVSPSGSFTDETVPGDLSSAPETNPDFGELGGGPFHRTKTFTARFTNGCVVGACDPSDGSFTKNNTWEATDTDGETIPFEGSKVVAGSEAGGRNSHVLFDTDVTLHTFTVDTATDGDETNVSEIGSGHTLTITDSLTLKSETFADADDGGTLDMEDGTTVERSGGTIDFTPTFSGDATVAYTAGLTTGPELPSTISSMRVSASSSTVTLGSDVTVSNTLDLDAGTLSDNGGSQTLMLSDGSTVQRSDGTLGFTPSFGTSVNVTYTAGVTTGNELSPSHAGTLTVDASGEIVGLEASTDPTLRGDLKVLNGTFADGGNTITIHGNATVDETYTTTSGGQLTFSGGNGTHTLAGSGSYDTVELNESGDFSGAEATISEGASFENLIITDGALEVQSSGATVTYAVTIDSELQLSGPLDVGGPLTVNGTIAASGQTITLNGSSAQTLGGTTSPFSLGSLTLNNSNGATLETDLSIAGTLALTSGTLSRSGNQTLTMQDGSLLQVGTGGTGFAPTYNGTASLSYTTGTTTGSELTSPSLYALEVDAPGQTVTMAAGANPTVESNLVVNDGTLDLNGNDVRLTGEFIIEIGTLVDNASTGGTVTFDRNGKQNVTGDPAFASVTLNTTVDFGSSPTVNGTLTLNPGGSVTTSAPNYSGSATLRYETGTTTNRGLEWSSTSGAGYPTDVTLANGTTLDLSAGDATAARSIAGALTIGGGSTLDMDDLSAALTVGNGATVNGTLTLGSASGGDLTVSGGDLTVDGTLTANGRTVTLSGSNAQTLGGTASSLSLGSLTVDNANGATLDTEITVSKLLTLTSGTLTSNGNLTLQSTASQTAAVAGSGSGTVSGDVTMERHVGFPDDGTNNSHWRFLASPLSVMLDDAGTAGNSDNLLSNVWTQSTGSGSNAQVSAGNATIFTYAENTNVNNNLNEGWSEVATLNDGPVSPGDGYLTYLFENNNEAGPDGFPVTLSVTGSLPSNETDGTDAAPALTLTDDSNPDSQNGWNLVANPFAAPLDWESVVDNGLEQVDKTIYVWDPESGQYATYTADGGGAAGAGTQNQFVAPFQSFFVKAGPPPVEPPDPPTKSGALQPGMTLTSADKSAGATPSLKSTPPDSSAPRITLQLRAASDSTGETTVVRYTNEAYAGKDRLDAYQLKPFRADYALLASGMDGRDALFDLQSRPVPAVRDTLDLALDVTASGTYTLDAAALEGLPGGWKVILEHEETGARHDLGAGEAVTFDYTAPESKASEPSHAGPAAAAPTVATISDSTDALPSYRLYVGPQAALPVELASFDATADAQAVSLTWRTASETNNAGFTVERRTGDAGAWTEVGTREGAGTTTQPQSYRFRDANVPFAAETLTYRLRQADLDGTTTLTDPITVSLAAPAKTTLRPPFPNPVRQQATIRYTLPRAQDVTIALYDVLGRRVRTLTQGQQTAGRHEQTVDLSGLSSGAYFVRMRARNATHTRRLTVVQ